MLALRPVAGLRECLELLRRKNIAYAKRIDQGIWVVRRGLVNALYHLHLSCCEYSTCQ